MENFIKLSYKYKKNKIFLNKRKKSNSNVKYGKWEMENSSYNKQFVGMLFIEKMPANISDFLKIFLAVEIGILYLKLFYRILRYLG